MLAYFHGFASGPSSTKAQLVRSRLAELGYELSIPDLAPDFTHQTITSQLAIAERLLDGEPAILMGSSLGGYLAALVAARHPERVRALVLLAPAFAFAPRWEAQLGPEVMAHWRRHGVMPVMHYGREREELLSVELLDDARRYPDEPDPEAPALVIAGRFDDAVPLAAVEAFAAKRPQRELVVYDAGHQLTEVLEPMWARMRAFLARFGIGR
ncbi:MAG TPA: YqiA/YcfP family alpha/beta fold hydrolase [Candidatus Limnocylindria bacterium]|nr:YqiA/YcfP family alpha/beta fold hydrolase [Candidatus Limnocylindria bacterium]